MVGDLISVKFSFSFLSRVFGQFVRISLQLIHWPFNIKYTANPIVLHKICRKYRVQWKRKYHKKSSGRKDSWIYWSLHISSPQHCLIGSIFSSVPRYGYRDVERWLWMIMRCKCTNGNCYDQRCTWKSVFLNVSFSNYRSYWQDVFIQEVSSLFSTLKWNACIMWPLFEVFLIGNRFVKWILQNNALLFIIVLQFIVVVCSF